MHEASGKEHERASVTCLEGWIRKSSSDVFALRREAQALLRVDHPGVPRLGALLPDVDDPRLHHLYVERVGQADLSALSDFDPNFQWRVLAGLFATLESLHGAAVTHGDLKPEHIRFDADGLWLVDFGLAGLPGAPAGSIAAGTMGYAAPEVLQGGTGATFAADVFSAAVSVASIWVSSARVLAAQLEFDELVQRVGNVLSSSPATKSALVRALSAQPAERPAAGELAEAILRDELVSKLPAVPWASVLAPRLEYPPPNVGDALNVAGPAGCGVSALLRSWGDDWVSQGGFILDATLPIEAFADGDSIRTLHRHLDALLEHPNVDLLVIDEAHSATGKVARRRQREAQVSRAPHRLAWVGARDTTPEAKRLVLPRLSSSELRHFSRSRIERDELTAHQIERLTSSGAIRAGLEHIRVHGTLDGFVDPTPVDRPVRAWSSDRDLVGDAQTVLRRGDVEGACTLLENARGRGWPLSLKATVELEITRGRLEEAHIAIAELDAIKVDTTAWKAHIALQRGRLEQACKLARESLRGERDESRRSSLLNTLGLARAFSGRHARGRRCLRRAHRLARRTGDLHLVDRLCNSLGIVAQLSGKVDEALVWYRRALKASQQAGRYDRAPTRLINAGTLEQDRGRYDRAYRHFKRAMRAAVRYGSARDQVRALTNLANLEVELGSYDQTLHFVSVARSFIGDDMSRESDRLALIAAEAHLEAGNPEAARVELDRPLRSSDAKNKREHQVLEARWHLARSERVSALALLEPLAAQDDPRAALWLLVAALDGEQHVDVVTVERWMRMALGEPSLRWIAPTFASVLYERAGEKEDATNAIAAALHRRNRFLDRLPASHRRRYQERPVVQQAAATLRANQTEHGALPRLLEVNEDLCRCESLDDLLDSILAHATGLLGCERGLLLVDRNGVDILSARHHIDHRDQRFSSTVANRVLETGESLLTSDALADPRFSEQASVQALRLRSVLCVPVRSGQIRGALYLDHRVSESVFSKHDLELAEAFANQAAIALRHADYRERLTQRAHDLEEEIALKDEELEWARTLISNTGDEADLRRGFPNIVAQSRGMLSLLEQVRRFAPSPIPVFINGESGTGKELIARAFHEHSARNQKPFVALNCAAVPKELLESELFGVRRGAFTGATHDRPGVFRVASGGTIFLDEVGDMPPEMQVKLLRVIENGTFRAVGGESEEECDVRVVCASHKALETLVSAGAFRADLYYRLAGLTVSVPALHQRPEDIPPLVQFLLRRAASEFSMELPAVDSQVLDALQSYRWPGNVRELDNELRRAMILGEGRLRVGHLSPSVRDAWQNSERPSRADSTPRQLKDAMRAFERAFLNSTLEQHGGDVTEAALSVGISRSSFYSKLKTLRD
ncbi:MAG: sigma 54-interacting transcriptional regulator [Myxococcota bacterium]